jgi:hypothetical protein
VESVAGLVQQGFHPIAGVPGLFLMGSLLISFGCLASALTKNQVTAGIVTLVFGVGLLLLGYLVDSAPGRTTSLRSMSADTGRSRMDVPSLKRMQSHSPFAGHSAQVGFVSGPRAVMVVCPASRVTASSQ